VFAASSATTPSTTATRHGKTPHWAEACCSGRRAGFAQIHQRQPSNGSLIAFHLSFSLHNQDYSVIFTFTCQLAYECADADGSQAVGRKHLSNRQRQRTFNPPQSYSSPNNVWTDPGQTLDASQSSAIIIESDSDDDREPDWFAYP
jgi:hypothetical protein